MKIIELEFILTFIGTMLGLISFANYLTGDIYPLTLYVSVFCLFASKWIELVDRVEIKWPTK